MVYNQGRGQIYSAKYKYIYLPMDKYDNFQFVKYKFQKAVFILRYKTLSK